MCGIFGCVGEKDVSNLIIKGLKRLEYRGYDSAGLCLETDDRNFEILKSSNSNYPVDVLTKSLEKSKISSKLWIHTASIFRTWLVVSSSSFRVLMHVFRLLRVCFLSTLLKGASRVRARSVSGRIARPIVWEK